MFLTGLVGGRVCLGVCRDMRVSMVGKGCLVGWAHVEASISLCKWAGLRAGSQSGK